MTSDSQAELCARYEKGEEPYSPFETLLFISSCVKDKDKNSFVAGIRAIEKALLEADVPIKLAADLAIADGHEDIDKEVFSFHASDLSLHEQKPQAIWKYYLPQARRSRNIIFRWLFGPMLEDELRGATTGRAASELPNPISKPKRSISDLLTNDLINGLGDPILPGSPSDKLRHELLRRTSVRFLLTYARNRLISGGYQNKDDLNNLQGLAHLFPKDFSETTDHKDPLEERKSEGHESSRPVEIKVARPTEIAQIEPTSSIGSMDSLSNTSTETYPAGRFDPNFYQSWSQVRPVTDTPSAPPKSEESSPIDDSRMRDAQDAHRSSVSNKFQETIQVLLQNLDVLRTHFRNNPPGTLELRLLQSHAYTYSLLLRDALEINNSQCWTRAGSYEVQFTADLRSAYVFPSQQRAEETARKLGLDIPTETRENKIVIRHSVPSKTTLYVKDIRESSRANP